MFPNCEQRSPMNMVYNKKQVKKRVFKKQKFKVVFLLRTQPHRLKCFLIVYFKSRNRVFFHIVLYKYIVFPNCEQLSKGI